MAGRISVSEYLRREWDRPVELIRGVPIVRPAPDATAVRVRDNVLYVTGRWRWANAEQFDRRSEAAVVTGPDSVRHPLLSIYPAGSDPADAPPPLLAVEAVRPGEPWKDAISRAADLLRGGVSEVWLVSGRRRSVQVFRLADGPALFDAGEEVATPVLPGFRCPLAEFFAGT